MNKITLNNATIDIDELTVEQRNQLLDALTPVATKPERVLWTPKEGEYVFVLWVTGEITSERYTNDPWRPDLNAGSVFPTHEHAEAAKYHREAQSVIDRYCYAKGIDTRWKEGVTQWAADTKRGVLKVGWHTNCCNGSPFYVESEMIAEQIIADCGDEIRTVLLRGWV